MDEKYVSVSELRKLLAIPSDGQCTGCQFSTFHGCKDDSIQRACEAIDDAPEADVRPVVRGRWKHDGSDWKNRFICDQCGYKWFFEAEEAHFCPNCCADMREVKVDG